MNNKEKAINIGENNLDRCFGSKRDYGVTCALEMAEWKDKNPSVETIKKIVVYALRRTNIMLADDLENEVEWELLIKNALNEN